MSRTRIVTDVQVLAAQLIVERAAMGVDTVDDEIIAIANATRTSGHGQVRGGLPGPTRLTR